MLTQDFMRSGGTVDLLAQRYAIKASTSKKYPNLILLKYNQLDSPMSEPIVRECRGLILDAAVNWRVVSRSFDKFFNYGEGHAAPIDWATAQVQEKLDGSLCVLYHHDGDWHVQTSGTPDASGRVGDTDQTFADLFWQVFYRSGYQTDHILPQHNLAFELCSKWNRVVVIHEQPTLTLLAVRDRQSGQEISPDQYAGKFSMVRSFPLQSFDDVVATFATMEPMKQEGYVVVDGNYHRVKVKHPGYVAIHHMKDGISTRRLVEIVRAGEVGEFLTYFPEWGDEFSEVQTAFDALTSALLTDYERLSSIESQKDFALQAVKTRCSGALFAFRSGKTPSIRAFLARLPIDTLIKILGIRENGSSNES